MYLNRLVGSTTDREFTRCAVRVTLPRRFYLIDVIISLPLDVCGEVEGLRCGDVADDDEAAHRSGDEFILILVDAFFLPADGEQVGIDLTVDVKTEFLFAVFDEGFSTIQEPVIRRLLLTFKLGTCTQGCFIRFEFEPLAKGMPQAQSGVILRLWIEDELIRAARCAVIWSCHTCFFWNFVESLKPHFALIVDHGCDAVLVDLILHIGFVGFENPCGNGVDLFGRDEEV
jgi:hypothetical protein